MRQEDRASVQIQGELSAYQVIKGNPWGQKRNFKKNQVLYTIFFRNEDFYIEIKKTSQVQRMIK